MLAGGFSPYGTMGQGGNVYEMLETEYDSVNDSVTAARELRGAAWMQDASGLLPTNRSGNIGGDGLVFASQV
jgi:hypothetical protein